MTMNGSPLALWRGMPPRMHSASGSTVAVVLCFQAASPAGVKGNLCPGKILGDISHRLGVPRPFPESVQIRVPVGGARYLSRERRASHRQHRANRRQDSHLDARVYEATELRQRNGDSS